MARRGKKRVSKKTKATRKRRFRRIFKKSLPYIAAAGTASTILGAALLANRRKGKYQRWRDNQPMHGIPL